MIIIPANNLHVEPAAFVDHIAVVKSKESCAEWMLLDGGSKSFSDWFLLTSRMLDLIFVFIFDAIGSLDSSSSSSLRR